MSQDQKQAIIMNYSKSIRNWRICCRKIRHKFVDMQGYLCGDIGKVQQQFKLYIDTVKQQYEQSENHRQQLLESSKKMIKQLKTENQKLHAKLQQYGVDLKIKQSSKKNLSSFSAYKDKDRVKTDHSSYLQDNYPPRFNTQHTYMSPAKDKIKKAQFKVQLTDRQQNMKKRKTNEYKKKFQNYTVMAYMGSQKKRKSKDKNNNFKKVLLSFSGNKKINSKSEIKQKQELDKKIYNSLDQLFYLDVEKQENERVSSSKKYKRKYNSSIEAQANTDIWGQKNSNKKN